MTNMSDDNYDMRVSPTQMQELAEQIVKLIQATTMTDRQAAVHQIDIYTKGLAPHTIANAVAKAQRIIRDLKQQAKSVGISNKDTSK